MEELNTTQIIENKINREFELLKKLSAEEKIEDKEKIIISINKEKENYLKSNNPDDIVRGAILSYELEYNPQYPLWHNKETKELAKELIDKYLEDNIIEVCLDLINKKFSSYSPFRVMISFQKSIDLNQRYLELFFKMMMIKQNIQDILRGIKLFFKIKEKTINYLGGLDFKNPYTIILFRDFLNELIINAKGCDAEEILKGVISNMKTYYLFRCKDCLQILYVSCFEDITFTCINRHYFLPKSKEDLLNMTYFNIKCEICKINIELFETNYKCLECQKYFCQSCADKHKNNNIQNVLINLYEVGYICEEHCQRYSAFCAECKQNLCKKCVISHFHRLDQKNIYQINQEALEGNKKKNLNEISNLEDYVSVGLSFNYIFMKDFSYYNFFIELAIWFFEKTKRKDERTNYKFFFESFFDENFEKYYSDLIDNAKKGKQNEFFLLETIKDKYDEFKIKIDNRYDKFLKLFFINSIKRNNAINNIIRRINNSLLLFYLYESRIDLKKNCIDLKTKIEKLESDISLLKIKILSLLKMKELLTSNLVKIINRYLSDMLLRKLITKYPNNFEKITISHKNFYEILINYKDIFFKSINNSIFDDLKNKLNFNANIIFSLNEKDRTKDFDSFVNSIKDENIIAFKEPISINNEIFSVKELNFLVETFFCKKLQGNFIVHPNIKSKEKIKLKNIKEEIPQSNAFSIESKVNNNDFFVEKNELFEKDEEKEIKSIIKEKTMNIKDELLKGFNKIKIKENVTIGDISNCILKNDFKNLYLVQSAFSRGLSIDLDSLIDNYINNIIFKSAEYDDIKNNIKKDKEILKGLKKQQKLLKKYQIEINDYIYRNIKNYCKKYLLENIIKNEETGFFHSESNIIYIIDNLNLNILEIFKNKKNNNFDDCEIEALILSIILPEILNIGDLNLNIYKSNMAKSIKSYFVMENIKKLLEIIYERLNTQLRQNNNRTDLIEEVRKFINGNKSTIIKDLSSIDISEEKINDMIIKIFEDYVYNWVSEEKTKINLESFLFYHQNINS